MASEAKPKYIKLHLPQLDPIIEPLFFENGKKRWLQSSKFKMELEGVPEADLAILPIQHLIEVDFPNAFNDLLKKNSAKKDVHLEVTMPLSIMGYPLGLDEGLCWVTGKVATSLKRIDQTFLVNAYSYEGMSGAPVLWVYSNRPVKLEKGVMVNSISGTFVQFAGIYSGRMYEKNVGTYIVPLARIWPPGLVDEILCVSAIEAIQYEIL